MATLLKSKGLKPTLLSKATLQLLSLGLYINYIDYGSISHLLRLKLFLYGSEMVPLIVHYIFKKQAEVTSRIIFILFSASSNFKMSTNFEPLESIRANHEKDGN